MYDVFTRTWWRENATGTWPNGLEPCPGKRRYHARGVSEEEALVMCKAWNATHKPGRLSRKMEYEKA